jgi:uncharacterized protein involved in type VI secretion and phage assembly
MRLLLLGGGGFIGRDVLSELLGHGVEVVATVRHADGPCAGGSRSAGQHFSRWPRHIGCWCQARHFGNAQRQRQTSGWWFSIQAHSHATAWRCIELCSIHLHIPSPRRVGLPACRHVMIKSIILENRALDGEAEPSRNRCRCVPAAGTLRRSRRPRLSAPARMRRGRAGEE